MASGLISLLIGQSKFYDRTDDQMNAEQVAQATFDMLSAELRMAASGDLIAATADSVTFRFDVARGVVCDSTASDEATLYVYDRTHERWPQRLFRRDRRIGGVRGGVRIRGQLESHAHSHRIESQG